MLAGECPADRIDEIAQVAYVYDGDTIRLTDGRRVRLAGINTPEVAHHGKKAEPMGNEARLFLSRLLPLGGRVQLRYERERKDHYGRLLAHLYLMDGRSIEALLLADGLAQQLVVPPNSWQSGCYQQVEHQARTHHVGIWRLAYYRPIEGPPPPSRGSKFRSVKGVVERIATTRKSVWLNLDSGVALRIPRANLPQFTSINLYQFRGHEVVARGWLRYERGHYKLTVRHPSALLPADKW